MVKMLKLNLKLPNLKLKTKLMVSFIFVAFITLVVGMVGLSGVYRLSGSFRNVADTQLPKIQTLYKLNMAKAGIDSCEKALLDSSLTGSDRETYYSKIQVFFTQIALYQKAYESLVLTKDETDIWNNLLSCLENYQKNDEELQGLSKQFDLDKSKDTYNEMVRVGADMNGILADGYLKQLISINNNISDGISKQAKVTVNWVMITVLIGIAGGTFIALALGIFLSLSITNPMNSAVVRLGKGARQVASASVQLEASSQQLAQGSAEQASATEETCSTLQEIGSMLKQNTANTKQAALLSKEAQDSAVKGNIEMQEMLNSIQEIKKSSDKISKIIKVIDDIAFQTNILALNAAIESARAGEAGLGFAVVAEEVRNLAQRSAQAAEDTTSMIEANIELSGEGVVVAERVRKALIEISDKTKKVNELMGEIDAATREHAQGVEQVNKGMRQIDTVTQQNASNAEESAAAAGELSAQADNLRKIVYELSQLVHGKAEDLKITMLDANYQMAKALGTSEPNLRGNDNVLPDKSGKKTKIISPEDVIPLEKDPHQF